MCTTTPETRVPLPTSTPAMTLSIHSHLNELNFFFFFFFLLKHPRRSHRRCGEYRSRRRYVTRPRDTLRLTPRGVNNNRRRLLLARYVFRGVRASASVLVRPRPAAALCTGASSPSRERTEGCVAPRPRVRRRRENLTPAAASSAARGVRRRALFTQLHRALLAGRAEEPDGKLTSSAAAVDRCSSSRGSSLPLPPTTATASLHQVPRVH